MRIHQGILSQSSLRHLEYGMLIDWFSCPTHNCKHWIADIHFMEKVILENPQVEILLRSYLDSFKILIKNLVRPYKIL